MAEPLNHTVSVVTYQSRNAKKVSICTACAKAGSSPRDPYGDGYHEIAQGEHPGRCSFNRWSVGSDGWHDLSKRPARYELPLEVS